MSDHRPPPWSRVWLEARRRHRDPVAALLEAGLIEPIRTDPPGMPTAGPHRRDGPAAELADGQAAGDGPIKRVELDRAPA